MYLAYYDEAGDDGYPTYSSPLFVFSACYLHHLHWKTTFQALIEVRRQMKSDYGIPVLMEMHWRHFLLDKEPYRSIGLSEAAKLAIIGAYCDALAQLNIKFVNICIVKPRVQSHGYQVLDTAFKYSIQRIENDLDPTSNPDNRFMIITDPGRVGKMRKTARRIQRVNYIPSKFGPDSYRKEIETLIEDPLPKDSDQSFFIQSCDLVSYLVYLDRIRRTGSGSVPNRLPNAVDSTQVEDWLNRLLPSLNTQAATEDPWGVKEHPA